MVKLVKEGYITQEFSYIVPTAPATVTKTMILAIGTLSVTTTPTGAKVSVYPIGGGLGVGCTATPCTFALASKDYTVKVEKTGYETITEVVTIVAGETVAKSYTLTPSPGILSVTTSPTGASVTVGTETRTSPCNFTLAPGIYIVVVSKLGYDMITNTVTITAGVTTTKSYTLALSEVTVTFVAKKEDGSELTGTSVYIDGVLKGTT
ncbi:PEGA domain-containing protein [Candidatus Babeliales bacterium]|nr:PEGA domain-containing protein [Candidatus Babeliales bacterium]